MNKYLYLIATLIFFASCEKDADIKVDEIDPTLAISALIGHDQPIKVNVQAVKSIFSANPDAESLSGAIVKVYSDLGEETFVEDPVVPGIYISADTGGILGKGKSGVTYTVEVSYPDYPTARGTCTVPSYEVPNVGLEYYSSLGKQYADSNRRVRLNWPVNSGSTTYFRYGAQAYFDSLGSTSVTWSESNMEVPAAEQVAETIYGSIYSYNYNPGINQLDLEIFIKTMDRHLYQYMKTYDLHYFAQDNPFAEPVIMYSNVEGGLGIVGGYREASFTKKVY